MGKYQLDSKGQAQVRRFHEKHSRKPSDKRERLAALREQFIRKAGQDAAKTEKTAAER